MMRKVSLYIPCYNAERFIAQCLEGIFKQSYPIDEILVIDDGPGDESAKIVSRYPVTLIRRREKLGISSARNAAFRRVRNNFVAALDADCLPEADWLEKLMGNFINDDIAGVGGMTLEKYINNTADKWRMVHMKQHWGSEKIINPPFLFGTNNVFRKDIILDIGLYDEKFKIGAEDVDLSRRLKERNFKLVYEPKAKVNNLRKDTILSILQTHWRWVFMRMFIPDSFSNFLHRTYDTFLESKKLLREDFLQSRFSLLGLDALMFLHHSFCNLKYYISTRGR